MKEVTIVIDGLINLSGKCDKWWAFSMPTHRAVLHAFIANPCRPVDKSFSANTSHKIYIIPKIMKDVLALPRSVSTALSFRPLHMKALVYRVRVLRKNNAHPNLIT